MNLDRFWATVLANIQTPFAANVPAFAPDGGVSSDRRKCDTLSAIAWQTYGRHGSCAAKRLNPSESR
jgi:hypothetical protein